MPPRGTIRSTLSSSLEASIWSVGELESPPYPLSVVHPALLPSPHFSPLRIFFFPPCVSAGELSKVALSPPRGMRYATQV